MSIFVILIGVVAFFALKKFFIKSYPVFTNKKISGLFVLPLLLLVYMGITLTDTISLKPINSTEFYKATGLLVQFKGGQEKLDYEGFLYLYKGSAEFFFFVVLCCTGFSLYKIFNLHSIRSSRVKLIMGIATVACIICYLVSVLYLSKLDDYLSGTSLDELYSNLLLMSWGGLIIGLIFLIISWIYFSKSLNIATSIKLERAVTNNTPMTKEDKSRSKTQELLELKSLLDSGILTQEEFDAQKKEILNS